MHAGPVGRSLIWRVMKLACTFYFKSKCMNNSQQVKVGKNT